MWRRALMPKTGSLQPARIGPVMWRRALMPKTGSLQPAMRAGARIRVDGLCPLSRPLSNSAKPGGGSWLGSTKQVAGDRDVLGDSQHTTRFGMKTCSCCIARTVAGLFVGATATVAIGGTMIDALEQGKCVGEDCKKKSSIGDNNLVAVSASMMCAGVVALVLMP